MGEKKDWFGVKTFYVSETSGRVENRDRFYKKESVMLEERVVIFKAKNFDAAIKLAESEAKKYAKCKHINPYRETVTCKYIDIYDAFKLYDDPTLPGAEVFSATELHMKKGDAVKAAKSRFGPSYRGKLEQRLRLKFRHW